MLLAAVPSLALIVGDPEKQHRMYLQTQCDACALTSQLLAEFTAGTSEMRGQGMIMEALGLFCDAPTVFPRDYEIQLDNGKFRVFHILGAEPVKEGTVTISDSSQALQKSCRRLLGDNDVDVAETISTIRMQIDKDRSGDTEEKVRSALEKLLCKRKCKGQTIRREFEVRIKDQKDKDNDFDMDSPSRRPGDDDDRKWRSGGPEQSELDRMRKKYGLPEKFDEDAELVKYRKRKAEMERFRRNKRMTGEPGEPEKPRPEKRKVERNEL